MKYQLMSWFCGLMSLLLVPLTALADEEKRVDAHLAGYKNVQVESSSTALTWLLLMGLAVLCLAGLFKNAKRTHLD